MEKRYSRRGVPIRKGSKKKDTVNYTLYQNNERVYEGITFKDRLPDRALEHKRSGKKFDKVRCDKPVTRAKAYSTERRRIERFNPRYNYQYAA